MQKKLGGKLIDIAHALGRHHTTISKHRGKQWLESCRFSDGSWDVAAAVAAYKEHVDPVSQFNVDCRHHGGPIEDGELDADDQAMWQFLTDGEMPELDLPEV